MDTKLTAGDHVALRDQLQSLYAQTTYDVERNACLLASDVRRLDAHLFLHLAVEQHFLYPDLLRSDNTERVRAIRDVQRAASVLRGTLRAFCNRYTDAATIRRQPVAFVHEARTLCEAFLRQIEWEESVLYSGADALCTSS